jgi:hypothetical protein
MFPFILFFCFKSTVKLLLNEKIQWKKIAFLDFSRKLFEAFVGSSEKQSHGVYAEGCKEPGSRLSPACCLKHHLFLMIIDWSILEYLWATCDICNMEI